MRACPSGSGYSLQVLARGLLDIFTNVNARCGLSAAIPHASIIPNKKHMALGIEWKARNAAKRSEDLEREPGPKGTPILNAIFKSPLILIACLEGLFNT